MTTATEQTYALVVGIERYKETTWNVPGGGPVHDALKFADWLKQSNVPQENIHLCLSYLEENQQFVDNSGFAYEEATEQNISNLVENVLSQQTGDLLYIFWAGHGLLTSQRNRRLLFTDASKQNWRNLDLNSLLLFLKSDLCHIRQHICFIDACANYLLESDGRPTNLQGKVFSSGQPRTDNRQFVLLATREGERAKVNSEERTGYFSQIVIEELAQEKACHPPNMISIKDKIKQRFQKMEKKQLPTYFCCDTWDGAIDEVHLNPLEVPHNIRISHVPKFVDRLMESEQLHKLLNEKNIVAITGETAEGGFGKSELAIQYSLRKLEYYTGGCCWLDTEGEIGEQLAEFAKINFLNFSIPEGLSISGQVAYCWRNWNPGKVLIIFDNVTEMQQIEAYLPHMNTQFKVLITTRNSSLPCSQLSLSGLPSDAAVELIEALIGKEKLGQETDLAKIICSKVNNHPFGIYQIAAAVKSYGR